MVDKFREVRNILFYVLLLNLVVSLAKIIYGTLTNTVSMLADGYHSLFDGISNVIGLIGIHIASKPPDKEHPYGHQKYETMASVVIAILLLFVGFEILHSSIERFMDGVQPEITSLSFGVMLATMGINLFVTTYEHKKGTLLKSEVLIADSLHTRTDIYVSLSVIAGFFGIKMGYPILDPIIALIIAAVIVRAGISIIHQSTYTLCDVSRLDEESICCVVLLINGVLECHKVRTRGRAGDIHIDLHVLVDSDLSVENAHLISHTVSRELKKRFPDVTDVVVHIEPGKR